MLGWRSDRTTAGLHLEELPVQEEQAPGVVEGMVAVRDAGKSSL